VDLWTRILNVSKILGGSWPLPNDIRLFQTVPLSEKNSGASVLLVCSGSFLSSSEKGERNICPVNALVRAEITKSWGEQTARRVFGRAAIKRESGGKVSSSRSDGGRAHRACPKECHTGFGKGRLRPASFITLARDFLQTSWEKNLPLWGWAQT